jgi:ABC-type branched-subunit amino acid transport system substrate-binding protein
LLKFKAGEFRSMTKDGWIREYNIHHSIFFAVRRTVEKLLLSIVFLVCTASLVACNAPVYSCTDPLGCLEIPPDSPLVIGVLTTLVSEGATAGTEMLASVQRASEEIGPILGHEVDLIWQGTDCSETSARLAAEQLVQTPDLLAVIGPSCPAEAPHAVPILEDAGIAVISPLDGHGDTSYEKLVSAVEMIALFAEDGTLILPRAALQEALQNQP